MGDSSPHTYHHTTPMKLMRNPGGVVAWHSDADAAFLLAPIQDRPSQWEVLLSCDSDEEVPEELKAEALALMRGDAYVPAPVPAPTAPEAPAPAEETEVKAKKQKK